MKIIYEKSDDTFDNIVSSEKDQQNIIASGKDFKLMGWFKMPTTLALWQSSSYWLNYWWSYQNHNIR